MFLIYENFIAHGDRQMPLSQPSQSPRQAIWTADRAPMLIVYNQRVVWRQLSTKAKLSQLFNWHRRCKNIAFLP
jgi:hypothetical protein